MDGLAQLVEPAEAKREVRHAARDLGAGQVVLDPLARLRAGVRAAPGDLLSKEARDAPEREEGRSSARASRSAARTSMKSLP